MWTSVRESPPLESDFPIARPVSALLPILSRDTRRARRFSVRGEAQPSQGIRLLSCLLSKLTLPVGTQGGAANCASLFSRRVKYWR